MIWALLIIGTGLEVEVAKRFPVGSRTSATWRSRRRRLIVLHDTARMGAIGTAHKDPLPQRAPVRLGVARLVLLVTRLDCPLQLLDLVLAGLDAEPGNVVGRQRLQLGKAAGHFRCY